MAAPRVTWGRMKLDIRDNLDENNAAFWSDDSLLRMCNIAVHNVWMEVRKIKAQYFDVSRTANDGVVTILGDPYDCGSLRLVPDVAGFTCPPDLAEMHLVEVITPDYEWVRIEFTNSVSTAEMRFYREITAETSPTKFLATMMGERTCIVHPFTDTQLDLRITYCPIMAELVDENSTLEMPHPLFIAVEELTTWRAQLKDRDPGATAWAAAAGETLKRFFGAHMRETQTPQYVEDFDP